MFLFSILSGTAQAEIPHCQAVRAIVGEASKEGYNSMVAHAHALRNRGSLKGVNGLKADHVDHEYFLVWKMAEKAWEDSKKGQDPTLGASCWFSEEDLRKLERQKPGWFMRLQRTVKIGSVTFYREPVVRKRK